MTKKTNSVPAAPTDDPHGRQLVRDDPDARLMDPTPLAMPPGAERFSDAQIAVMRRHPDVRFDPATE